MQNHKIRPRNTNICRKDKSEKLRHQAKNHIECKLTLFYKLDFSVNTNIQLCTLLEVCDYFHITRSI